MCASKRTMSRKSNQIRVRDNFGTTYYEFLSSIQLDVTHVQEVRDS
jgi:hypothetical protein